MIGIEPIPSFRYAPTQKADGDKSDSDDELNAGQTFRLHPDAISYAPQSLQTLCKHIRSPSAHKSALLWAKLFVLLDSADQDPHFTHLREFFNARKGEETKRGDPPASPQSTTTHETDTRSELYCQSSFRSVHLPKRFQWTRRPSLPAAIQALRDRSSGSKDDEAPPVPSIPRIFRGASRSSRRGRSAVDEVPETDMHELWVSPAENEARCIHFSVRLDLHNAGLAPAVKTVSKHHGGKGERNAKLGSIQNLEIGTPPHDAFIHRPSVSTSGEERSLYRSQSRSIMQRFLRRRDSTDEVESAWQPQEYVYDPQNDAAIDSDDEYDHRHSDPHSESIRNRDRRRFRNESMGSIAARSQLQDLARVDEDMLCASTEFVSLGMQSSHVDQGWPYSIQEGEDFLSLFREAADSILLGQFVNEAEHTGEADPLPATILYAMSVAFGWEGMMHLCYGPDSLAAREQSFAALGRAADIHSTMQRKYDAVLSWRSTIAPYDNETNDAPSDTLPHSHDSFHFPADLDETNSNDPRSSVLDGGASSVGNAADPENVRIARHILDRTWHDWQLLFESILGWTSEYEGTRIRNGLAPEFGFQEANTIKPIAPPGRARHDSRFLPSACVEADALHSTHGFRRMAGIPAALRLGPTNEEHYDYRWSRIKLVSAQVETPLLQSSASLQFFTHQLSAAHWITENAWELQYLNQCIFQSTMIEERFPPPSSAVVRSLNVYKPQPGKPDLSISCPYPNTHGAWNATEWKQWLGLLREGHVITPAIAWQAWWTLIVILNGGDRSGKNYDLQVKGPHEHFENLDASCVYI
ncbi:hypothetical protein MVES1_003534 [Malassezia vespertilionis]|uniref:uncharacterized protein n=1 Tax=Malassezia vespertilionis TaxID=2020962 RepID=UPI0024B23348|nr:uncharacterized protein MVES1_003534 [Malassezia vespertilionis]WFD08163.1 hypothetical protein MVES1_003534 [Malassezia vespertilionis]